ncbi:NtaA/DmoA family FMN-dependent monooxygenase [Nakamurella sp. YIM 132087]|uniref:NtaA/DmoA family FMN-dependent monooxygenase n=1 Tax=Nakamurella alba TaxID=2665158 RepID=A0A7K1FSI3_9ACTN|nr:LLM class flavin-dependent oxidoreductase [Nakamurella alba]MTD17106.1 NtaA/DmoA family FMN-dependent monooxygenase [Nakamurella alba]
MAQRKGPAVWAAFLWPGGHHHGAWRLPGSTGDDIMSFDNYRRMALDCERAKFDVVFLGDRLDAWPLPDEYLARTARGARLETITLTAALAAVTSRIGLVATASTTFSEPFNLARQIGSLDHISGGRIGWNVVTSYTDDQAQNYGLDHIPPRPARYARAQEFLDVVKGLWDTYEDDAVLRDKETGQFFDADRFHKLGHEGSHFKVAGPLNMERPPQGHPVICQAGASKDGIAFAARNGELLFSINSSIERARDYYQAIKTGAADAGRDPDDIKVLASINPVIGRTQDEAEEKYQQMQRLLDDDVSRTFAEMYFGMDLSGYPLDELVPEIELPDASHGMPRAHQEYMLNKARDEKLTMRQLVYGFNGTNIYPKSAEAAADEFQEWYETGAADGFILQISHVPEGVTDFVELVVPILRRRGLIREDYVGTTLRENLGLARPVNRHTTARSVPA